MTIPCVMCDKDIVIVDYADSRRLIHAMADEHKLPVCWACLNEYEITKCLRQSLEGIGHMGDRWMN